MRKTNARESHGDVEAMSARQLGIIAAHLYDHAPIILHVPPHDTRQFLDPERVPVDEAHANKSRLPQGRQGQQAMSGL